MTEPMESIEKIVAKHATGVYPRAPKLKLYLNQHEVEFFRTYALEIGKSEEWYNKWLEDCVVVVEPMD